MHALHSVGVSKKVQDFFFLEIDHPEAFRKGLHRLADDITTAYDILRFRHELKLAKAAAEARGEKAPLVECRSITIAFSKTGVTKVNVL
jgi:hypothetical protein